MTDTKIPGFNILYLLQNFVNQEDRGIMSVESKIVANIKGHLSKFSGIIS